jgi:hypothetical protein
MLLESGTPGQTGGDPADGVHSDYAPPRRAGAPAPAYRIRRDWRVMGPGVPIEVMTTPS